MNDGDSLRTHPEETEGPGDVATVACGDCLRSCSDDAPFRGRERCPKCKAHFALDLITGDAPVAADWKVARVEKAHAALYLSDWLKHEARAFGVEVL